MLSQPLPLTLNATSFFRFMPSGTALLLQGAFYVALGAFIADGCRTFKMRTYAIVFLISFMALAVEGIIAVKIIGSTDLLIYIAPQCPRGIIRRIDVKFRANDIDAVCDFVSVGDVSVKVIGAESRMPDCEVPMRALLEQIVAKLGIPPFLLGLSWSTTEKMSEQQADILTSELEYYRAALEPVIRRVVRTHLLLSGCNERFEVKWDDINLQDAVELSSARLNNAQAERLEKETEAAYGR